MSQWHAVGKVRIARKHAFVSQPGIARPYEKMERKCFSFFCSFVFFLMKKVHIDRVCVKVRVLRYGRSTRDRDWNCV